MVQGRRQRLLIADDHRFVAEAARSHLEPEFEVVGIVGDGQSLLQSSEQLEPDAVIVDIGMPLLNGLEAGKRIKARRKQVKLIYLTMNMDLEIAQEAFRCGASAYLPKTAAASELPVAVRAALRGELYISPVITRDRVGFLINVRIGPSPSDELTERQREVLQLLAEGKAMKEVAAVLDITPRTVAFHKYRIMKMLGLKNNSELIQYAIRTHLLVTTR